MTLCIVVAMVALAILDGIPRRSARPSTRKNRP